jgi:hypothetical protein
VISNSNGSGLNFSLNRGDTLKGIGMYSASTILQDTGVRDFLPHIVVCTNYECVIDGVQKATSNILMPNSWTNLGIASASFNGHIAELHVWNNAITESQSLLLSDFVNQKYAIY